MILKLKKQKKKKNSLKKFYLERKILNINF